MLARGEGETLFFTKLRRSKKGVGSVVGAVFVILIILSGFVFYQIALLTMNNYNKVTDDMNQVDWRRNNEELTILSVEVTDNNKFNITVKNTGSVQSVVIWLGIFEQSSSGSEEDQPFVSVNYPIAIGEVESIISTTQISPEKGYNIRLATELGNVYDCSISEAVEGELSLVLVAVTATVYVNNEISIILSVTNNNPYGSVVNNVNIELIEENEITSALTPSGSQTITSLSFGATKIFNWKCTAQNIGTAQFKASYEGGFVIATVEIKTAPTTEPNGQGQVTITGSNATQKYSPLQWTTLGETTYLSGTVADLSSSDNNKVVFESYYTGTEDSINKYVTSNTSNVDGIENVGTMHNFEGMQSEPNGDYATLIEEQTSTAPSFGNPNHRTSDDSYWLNQRDMLGVEFNSGRATGEVYNITFYGHSESGTIGVKAIICDSSGNILNNGISQVGPVNSVPNWYTLNFINPRPEISSDENYWIMIIFNDPSYIYFSDRTDNYGRFDGSNNYNNPSDPTDAIDIDYHFSIYANISKSEGFNLDFEVQWTNLNTSPDSNELAIYLMEQTGEGLAVDVWTGSEWQTLSPNLSSEWNNIPITSYLTSSTFTIRFRDVTPYDPNQDSWDIKTAVIRQTGQIDQYTCEVEFTGTSNTEVWQSILWNVETSFDADDVVVTIQFYDYNQNAYVTSGDGYSSFLSIAEQSNIESQTINSNFDRFSDSSGTWKVRIVATKDTSDQFTINVDWIELQTTYESGGNTVAYGEFQEYTIKATSATGVSAAFMYASIHVNGTNITLLNADTNQPLANPAWVQLDVNGEYRIKLQSTNSASETFVILVSVGTTIGQKTVTQEAQ
ncbi:MAG: hypothetical protein IAX22_03105 [Candidatus Bathyarchaeota archaeon]|nr:hypothetical protein [Candidatus Bathyarchaeota archaeon]